MQPTTYRQTQTIHLPLLLLHLFATTMANKPHKTFMPLLCRFSVNDTAQPAKLPGPSSADPSSPKLSCIGQVKKKSTVTNNNRFLPCNLSASGSTRSTKSSVHSNNYKLFSGKSITSPAVETASIKTSKSKYGTNRSKSCNGRRTPVRSNKCYMTSSRDDHDIVRVVVAKELDPPLPVVKCGSRDQEVNVNLWKRRGIELETLQIQPIRLSVSQNSNDNNGGFSVPSSATT
ncbi:hypothetical protein HanRHA438_Chr04g0159841 [Helianthus annuus]|uniref:uncharacterized protein LOC110934512 n=1 Tax=Helianthus annuus TaxID=4232 RepID=UPI000B90581E|nr:uncharacterized protein LOC110934512 [Helianthus annuus]KAJ0925445.1 hypothetical protein HanRHA438_Chr04g0159841 [Helianthus annuus]